MTIAVLVSLGAHLGVLFGVTPVKRSPPPGPADDTPVVPITIFDLEDLEEPEPSPAPDSASPAEDIALLPVLVDTPTTPAPDDFLQPVDLSSLLERPATANIMAVPADFIRHPVRRPGGPVFNLADLERTPVPIAQPAPAYPHAMRREALNATVVVGFIVDLAGTVLNPQVVDSTHPGFNDAAVAGVSKWKFRAGMRGGERVNTRMQVPIVFRLADDR